MFSSAVTSLLFSAALVGQVSLPLGNPPGEIPASLLHATPEDAVAAVIWAPSKSPSADSKNHFEQLLADDEVQIFLSGLEKQLDEFVTMAAEEEPDLAATRKKLKDDLFALAREGGTLYLHSFDPMAATPKVEMGLLIAPKDAELVKGYVAQLSDYPDVPSEKATVGDVECFRVPAPDVDVYFGEYKGMFFINASEAGTLALFKRLEAAKPPAWIATLDDRIPVKQVGGYAHLNVDGLKSNFGPMAEMPQAKQILKATGVDAAKSLGAVWGLDDDSVVLRTALEIEGELTGIFAGANVAPLTLKELSHLPKDATFATVGAMDPLATYKGILQIAADVQPGAEFAIKGGVAEFEEASGIEFEKDVLSALGNHWGAYFSYNDGGVLLSLAIKDKAAAEAVHGKLLSMAKAQADSRGIKSPVTSRSYQGKTIHYLKAVVHDDGYREFMPPVAWCVTDDHFYISVFPQTIQSQLDREAGGETLADQKTIKQLFADGRAPLWVGYQDTPELVRHLLPLAYAAGRTMLDASDWPSNAAIVPHLRPDVIALYKTDYGIEVTFLESVPGGGMLFPVALAGFGGTMMPYGLQRDIERGIERAFDPVGSTRRESLNNMRQIGLAALNWEATHSRLPGDICDKEGKPLLSWRVSMLPYLEEYPLHDKFKLDEPWDSEHNLALAKSMPEVFKSPGLENEAGKTRYQAIRTEDSAIPALKDGVQPKPNRLSYVRDGTSNTVWLIEAEEGVPWTKPVDYTPDEKEPAKGMAARRDGYLALFLDCHTQVLPKGITGDNLKALFTKSGGEIVDTWELDADASERFDDVRRAIPDEEPSDEAIRDALDEAGAFDEEEFDGSFDVEEPSLER
jgi:hypothetical protein